MEYQSSPIEPGQWYVSDTGPIHRRGDTPALGRNSQRMRGPFPTKAEAEAARKEMVKSDSRLKGNRLYVWQAEFGEHPPEKMEIILELLDLAFQPEGNFRIHPPDTVLENLTVLDSSDAVHRLTGTEWQLLFPSGTLRPVEFVDLTVLLFNIQKMREDRRLAREQLRQAGETAGEFTFSASADLDQILPSEKVRALLRSVRLELGPIPSPDPDAPEPKLTEVFNQNRINKCMEVWRGIFNNWSMSRMFDCRLVADERLDGKSLEELGKSYLSIGARNNLTRLPFLDALIVLDTLKQFNVHAQATGKPLEKFTVKTEYTQSEVYELLDEIRRAGIPIVIEPLT